MRKPEHQQKENPAGSGEGEMARLRCAMVCSSNQNRSMEAHALLKRHGFDVSSYGTGAHVKLPGPSLREPNVYDFGTPYKYMYDDLRRKDLDLYAHYPLIAPLPQIVVALQSRDCLQVQAQWDTADA